MAKAKKSKAKKSKAKKSKAKKSKVKKAAKRAAASSSRKVKKSKAKKSKAKRAAPKKAAQKSIKPAKKAAPKKAKPAMGEGDYQASRKFLKEEAKFVKRHKAEIPQMGKDAEAAMAGPQGGELHAAEQAAMSHSKAPGNES